MKTKLIILASSLLLLAGFTFQSPRQRWEYRNEYLSASANERFNELGAEGWELVAVARDDKFNLAVYYFKRAK